MRGFALLPTKKYSWSYLLFMHLLLAAGSLISSVPELGFVAVVTRVQRER